MDHRWDDSNRQDHAARGEHERYGARRIEDDPDVERRDRLREAERLASINQSPWSIGVSHWDQRDLYTRNNRIDEEGYGRGPSMHPERGSYAYPRQARNPGHPVQQRPEYEASLHEREAWPWLNYHDVKDHPSFAHLSHEEKHGIWTRLKDGVAGLLHVGSHASHGKAAPKNAARPDARLMEDVSDALTYRGDLDATDIEVTVHAGEVTLEGTVTDRRSKRIAEEVCEGVRGVHDVHNRLTIRKDDPTDANVAFVLPLAMLGT